jgi:hypothetical protein
MKFINNHHYFDWCALIENIWRSRVAKNPKTAKANKSVAEFHRLNPDHVVNLAQWRINRARRQAACRASSAAAL